MSKYESPYSRVSTLTEAQERIEAQRAEPPHSDADEEPLVQYRIHPAARHLLARNRWENIAMALIAIGVVMLMQPFAMVLFTYSFITILVGTIMFVIVSHFPEADDG